MKRYIQVLILTFCFVFTGSVFANQAIRIFEQTTKDDASWQNYLAMQDIADRESGFLPTHKLASQAYSTAVNRGYLELVPDNLRHPEIYQAIFILFNNLSSRDKIAFTELRERGQTSGIYLPNMRLFQKETGEGFEAFKAEKIAKAIKISADGVEKIPTSIIAALAFIELGSTSYMSLISENFRNQSNFISAFNSYNEISGEMSLEEFRSLGQGDGVWVPVEVEYIKTFAKAFAEKTATLMRQETLLKNTSEANVGIQALTAEIARLKKLGQGDSGQVKQINDLKIQLNKLVSQVSVLSESQNEMANNQVNTLSLLNDGLIAVKAKISEMGIAEASIIANTDAKIDNVYSGIERVAEVVAYNEKVIVVSLSIAIILALCLVFLVRGRDKRFIAKSMALNSERMDSLQGQIVGVTFDRQLVSKQAISLLPVGEVIVLPVTVKHESYEVKVARISRDVIMVEGIRHHANDKKNCHEYGIGTNVPVMIDRAANQGHLTNHFILEDVTKVA